MKIATFQETETIVSRHVVCLGYYVFLENFLKTEKMLYLYNLNKSGKSLTHSSCH